MPIDVNISRMESKLRTAINAAESHSTARCKIAELAAYSARLGKFDDARRELSGLRQVCRNVDEIELSVRINFAEGLLDYFENGGVCGADKMQRAHAIALAAGTGSLAALCAAWMAQFAYAKLDVNGMAAYVAEAIRFSLKSDNAALARACLVVAQALHLAGRFDFAQDWYRLSKHHATEDQDDATISAHMHNMSWLHMLSLRQVVLSGANNSEAISPALSTAESSARYDALWKDASWSELRPVLRAQIFSLQGDVIKAGSLYREMLLDVGIAKRLQPSLLADKAWCHACVGDYDLSDECARSAVESIDESVHMDDLAATHSRLASTYRILGKVDLADNHTSIAANRWQEFRVLQAQIVNIFSKLPKVSDSNT